MIVFLKKSWVFLKRYWYLPMLALILLLSAIFLMGKKNKMLIDMFDLSKKRYQKEIEAIEDNQKVKEIVQAKEKERYERALSELEVKIRLKKSEISRSQKKRVKQLVKEYGSDHKRIVKVMAYEYNFEIVE